MYARAIKKGLIFFIVDIVIIIGIFVLQFSNDSIITEKNGNLQITLSETKDSNNISVLQNKLTMVFNGVTVSCDDNKPAQILRSGSEKRENVALIGWKKLGDTEYQFDFTEDVSLGVTLTDSTEKGSLSFVTKLPSDVAEFYIPYTLASNTEISDSSSSRILMGSKKSQWEFTAASLENQLVQFTGIKPGASFSYFEKTVDFTFDLLAGSSLVANYDSVLRTFRDSIVASYKASTGDALLNESAVVAYVAEQGSRGNYQTALEDIPQSFRKSENRTYVSAPFFNNLVEMNKTLTADIKEKDNIIRKAVNNYSLSLFTIRNIANYMYLYESSGTIKRITETAGNAVIENASLSEAAGILRTYTEMMGLSKAYASHMEDSLNDCVRKIEKACKMEGNNLILSENGTFLSVVQAVEVGDALFRYGQYIGDQSLMAGGKAIIASYMSECSSFDLRTLSDLYPVMVHGNTYYPHFMKIYTSGDNVVWAWTCAESIDFERGEDKSITFNVNFPEGYTHYMMIRGVNAFRSIYIYDIAFRTDARFENYNSSGYIYDYETRTLLLKSRHKAEKETVRLIYAAPVSETETPAEKEKAETGSGNQRQPLSEDEIRRQTEEIARAQAEQAAQAARARAQAEHQNPAQ